MLLNRHRKKNVEIVTEQDSNKPKTVPKKNPEAQKQVKKTEESDK